MNKIWIGTNWKMHKTLVEGKLYCEELIDLSKHISNQVELFVIPSHTSLWPIKETLRSSRVRLGTQNMHWAEEGAFTGEISPVMLAEIGVDIIELGHSERRQYYNENDEDINKKVHAALNHGMKPLVCIGENIEQKNNCVTAEVISAQLKVCLRGVSEARITDVLIAYEPVWAIGQSGVPAEASYVSEVHSHIRSVLYELFGDTGNEVPLLYGGSVNQENFLKYLELKDVNGLFIGRAAWNMETFQDILLTVHSSIKHLSVET